MTGDVWRSAAEFTTKGVALLHHTRVLCIVFLVTVILPLVYLSVYLLHSGSFSSYNVNLLPPRLFIYIAAY